MGGLVCSALVSPLSPSTALVTVLQPGLPEFSEVTQSLQVAQNPVVSEASTGGSAGLPDVVSRVLGVVFDMMEEDGEDGPDVLQMMFLNRFHVLSTLTVLWLFPQMSQNAVSSNFLSGPSRKWAVDIQTAGFWRAGSSSVINLESVPT